MKNTLLFSLFIFVFASGQEYSIVLNEFLASSEICCGAEIFGNGVDFVELYNYGTDSVDITGWGFSDTDGSVTTTAPDTSISPGGFLVLWYTGNADGFPVIDEKLSSGGETIFIADQNGNTVITYDFESQTEDVSYGRYPDGGDVWLYFPVPTPGVSNTWIPEALSGIMINEFLASNDACCTDEYDNYDDFIELFNSGTLAVNIGGMYVTDDLADAVLWQIPRNSADSTTIAEGDFLLLWADKEPDQGILHVNVKLSGGGEQIGLSTVFSGDTAFVDSLTYGEQASDISWGMYPDGSASWSSLNPTPGASNAELGIFAEGTIPAQFSLHQNYPNPFNPSTTIRFDVSIEALITVTVWNILGQRMRTLISVNLPAGSYNLQFNGLDDFGRKLSAGVYFISMETMNWSATRKMILMN